MSRVADSSAPNSRPRVEILLPVWGKRYIETCLTTAVASLLSANNLSKLASTCDVTLVLLTDRGSEGIFRDSPIIEQWKALAAIDFIYIDDLIVDQNYAVPISLSVARAMLRHGRGMTGVHFIIMMSDFVLSDGALGALVEPILAGRSGVFAPTWRANDEEVSSYFERWRDRNGVIAARSRDLASIVLPNLHSRILASVIGPGICSLTHYDQFYWKVDDRTLIAHQMLMHLFCIRPERPITGIDYPFDYGLFEACCPSGDHVTLTDSDQFMVLERQRRFAESHYVLWGGHSPVEIAESVAGWTTSVHRMLGKYTCFLHSADLPQQTETVAQEANAFMDRLYGTLPAPLSPHGHPFWEGAVQDWARRRAKKGNSSNCAEFGTSTVAKPSRSSLMSRAFMWLASFLFGTFPDVTIFDARWSEIRSLNTMLSSLLASQSPVILCWPSLSLPTHLPQNVVSVEFDALALGALDGELRSEAAIVDLHFEQVAQLGDVFANLRGCLFGTRKVILVLRRERFTGPAGEVAYCLEIIRAATAAGLHCGGVHCAGTHMNHLARQVQAKAGGELLSHRGWRRLSGIGLLAASALLAAVANLRDVSRRGSNSRLYGHGTVILHLEWGEAPPERVSNPITSAEATI